MIAYQTAIVYRQGGPTNPPWETDRIGPDVEIPDVVRVTLGFNHGEPPVGRAKLHWEGDSLVAEIETTRDLSGLFPALGIGHVSIEKQRGNKDLLIADGTIREVSLVTQNVDPEIPPLELA